MNRSLILLCIVCVFLGVLSDRAWSQGTASVPSDLTQVIEQAKKDGVRVIIVDPQSMEAPPKTSAPLIVRLQSTAREVKKRFLGTLTAIPTYWTVSVDAIRSSGGDGTLTWPLKAAALSILFLLIGFVPAKFFAKWAERQFEQFHATDSNTLVGKISHLYLRGATRLVEVGIQVGAALLITLAIDFQPWRFRFTIFLVLFGWAAYRICSIFFFSLFAVDTPRHRLLNISDDNSGSLFRGATVVFVPMIVVMVGCVWQEVLGLDKNAHLLSLLIASLISALLLAYFVVSNSQAITEMIAGTGEVKDKPLGVRLLSTSWHSVALVYVFVAYGFLFARLLLELPNSLLLSILPLLLIFAAIAFYGAELWLIEWLFRDRPGQYRLADVTNNGRNPTTIVDGLGSHDDLPTYKGLFIRAARILAALAAGFTFLTAWGFRLGGGSSSASAFWKVFLVAFIAYLVWGSVKVAFDRKIAEEGGPVALVPGEEGGGAGSRLGTLLPLIRNFILIVLSAIVGMMVLIEAGVDVAPLFAGAGIVGLAIGFGAQTLVRDILSGAFFLMDDAFRHGEYIDVGGAKGTVEKISIRSLQLRHHLGPLNTVPFGEIKSLTNFSRDWVMMKLPLRVTYDTDIEKVRKLIKNLGQELLEDPTIGDRFLAPLKSQGVIKMEDSAMIVRVKFMTKPGDQWVVRKMVFARIRELFEREGIRFAHKEVTVRVAAADGEDSESVHHQKRLAAAGASAVSGEAGSLDGDTEVDR